ncbi:MAG TPA: AraC family transcriptional regulator [Clostridiales bacterium]|nr:AraC family transcriptional regulator [Clostridiales bacterium]
MRAFKEYVNLRDEGLPFNIWISERSDIRSYIDSQKQQHNDYNDLWHEFTEIVYVICGAVDQRINGNTYRMKKGDMAYINGLDLHSLYLNPNIYIKILIMQIPPSFISLYYREHWNHKIISNYFPFNGSDEVNIEIQRCMANIIEEFINKNSAYGYYLASHMYKLLGIIYRNTQFVDSRAEEYMKQKLLLEKISPAIDYIFKNYNNSISINDVSSLTGMCNQHFCKCFKKATKYTFTQYLNDVRVLYAQELLLTTNMNITEIAFSCGFSSVSYFNRVFKKKSGISPLEFRRK